MKKIMFALILFLAGSVCAFAWSVDFDGDGTSDASGSYGVPTVPTPVYKPPPDTSSSGDRSTSESQPADVSDAPTVDAGAAGQQEADLLRRRQNTVQIQQQQATVQQQQFQQGRNDLLQNMKGGTTGALGLKTGTDYSVKTRNLTVSGVESEQFKFEQNPFAYLKDEWKPIKERFKNPNNWASGIIAKLKGEVFSLPENKKFNELQPGDVLLISGTKLITGPDNLFSGGFKPLSRASHTVLYLKEVNGKKLFLDNQPFGKAGPRIISEEEYLATYGQRDTDVARLVGQPLNNEEAKKLFSAAVKMDQDNRKSISNNWFKTTIFGTNFGAWGEDDIVCAEVDWLLLKSTGRNIPKSDDKAKVFLGIDYSPADFRDTRYFLVTPLDLPERSKK